MNDSESPMITHLAWGEIQVKISGSTYHFKDCQIWPGGAREWDWNLTGTSHSKGIQIADIKYLLDRGAQEIVLSLGHQSRLRVPEETRQYLDSLKITFYFSDTGTAVEKFNELTRTGKAVGGLFHTTC